MMSASPSSPATSDKDNEYINPAVLKPVMEDLCRFTAELGPNHGKVADTWNSLGLIRLHMQHNAPAAIMCHQEALRIYRMNEASDPQLAVTLGDMGTCYERIGEEERALIFYHEALQLLGVSEVSPSHLVERSIRRSVARIKRE